MSNLAKNADKIKPVEILKILGEGSQGIVALCRFKETVKDPSLRDNDPAAAKS